MGGLLGRALLGKRDFLAEQERALEGVLRHP